MKISVKKKKRGASCLGEAGLTGREQGELRNYLR